jgi:hypothetical protein
MSSPQSRSLGRWFVVTTGLVIALNGLSVVRVRAGAAPLQTTTFERIVLKPSLT